MTSPAELVDQLTVAVRASMLDPKFSTAPIVAVLFGPCEVIECIVRHASKNSGIEMDWSYIGGRAYVHAIGNIDEARSALIWAMPGGLSINDL